MNINGKYKGVNWIGFVRQRAGRRKVLTLKYSMVPGEWRERFAPQEVTSEAKFRTWLMQTLDLVLESGEQPTQKEIRQGLTVREAYERWLPICEANKEIAGVTVRNYRCAFRKYVLPAWGEMPVLALGGQLPALRQWVRQVGAGISPERTSAVVSAFRKFLTDCRLEGWVALKPNPLDSEEVKSVMPAIPKKRKVVAPTVPQLQALFDCEKIEYRRAIRYVLGACSGAADGELAGCRVSDVLTLDGAEPRLRIARTYRTQAKPHPDGRRRWAELGPTKNEYRKRAIPLNQCAQAALKDWLEVGWEHWVGRAPQPEDPLLPSADGSFSRPAFAKLVRDDLEEAGQPTVNDEGKRYDFRSLRRAFSTTLRACKVDRELREQLMGQASNSLNSTTTRTRCRKGCSSGSSLALVACLGQGDEDIRKGSRL